MSEVRSLQFLWIAFVITPLLFAFLAFGGPLPAPPPGDPMMAVTLGGLAALVGAFGLVGAPLVLKNMAAQPAYLVRFSCAEAIGVFGLVAHLTPNTRLSLGPLKRVSGSSVVRSKVLWNDPSPACLRCARAMSPNPMARTTTTR